MSLVGSVQRALTFSHVWRKFSLKWTVCSPLSVNSYTHLQKQGANMLLFYCKIYIFIYSLMYHNPTAVSVPSFPPSLFPPTFPLPRVTPLLCFLSKKGQASQKYQPNMSYQVSIRLNTYPHSKAGWNNPVREKKFPKANRRVGQPLLPELGVP